MILSKTNCITSCNNIFIIKFESADKILDQNSFKNGGIKMSKPYSVEEKLMAVNLYYQYNKRPKMVINKLNYLNNGTTLFRWVKEFETKGYVTEDIKKTSKFTGKQRDEAVHYYLEHGNSISETVKALGYPSRQTLISWLDRDLPDRRAKTNKSYIKNLDQTDRIELVEELILNPKTVDQIAKDNNIDKQALYYLKNKYLGKGNQRSMAKKDRKSTKDVTEMSKQELIDNIEQLKLETKKLRDEQNKLLEEKRRLKIELDVLEVAAELLKKDEGISIDTLTNKDKAIIIDVLKQNYKLKELLSVLKISKSSYFYAFKALLKQDKYLEARYTIRQIFIDNKSVYGYRRIKSELKKKGIILSDKVIIRIMKEEGLKVNTTSGHKKFSSYMGEISPRVENLINRDFHSGEPNEKLLTDISEFSVPAGKVYLSPIIDCFDGMPITWTVGTSPNAELVNTMLDNTKALIPDDAHPIVHSDCGAHYRWPGWISRMEEYGFIRSMSKKGYSPDNSACEGFFGTIKKEFFYGHDWSNVTIEEFISKLNDYINWFKYTRIKMSLNGLSPVEYRKSLGLL